MEALVRKLSDRIKSSATAALIRHASSRPSPGGSTPPAATGTPGPVGGGYAPPEVSVGSNASSFAPPAASSAVLNIKEPKPPQQQGLRPVGRSEGACAEGAKECFASLGKSLGSCFLRIKICAILAVVAGWFPLLIAGLISKGVLENIDKENLKSAGNATQAAADDGGGGGSQMRWPMIMIIVAGCVGGLVLLGGCEFLSPEAPLH
jgi:hypothetical protein